jgi:hypothetical protein
MSSTRQAEGRPPPGYDELLRAMHAEQAGAREGSLLGAVHGGIGNHVRHRADAGLRVL